MADLIGTKMQSAIGDPPVYRIEPAAYSAGTSLQAQFPLLNIRDNNTRNLQTVLFATSANSIDRLRAFAQLKSNVENCRDAEAYAVLAQFKELGLKL